MNNTANKARKMSQTVKGAAVASAIAASLVAGSIGIAGASQTSSHATSHSRITHATGAAQMGQAPGPGGGPGGPAGHGGPGALTVTAINGDSLTVQSPTGTSFTVSVTSSTTISKDGATASESDIAVGDTISVLPTMTASAPSGPPASGSTVTASAIVIQTPHLAGKVVSTDSSSGHLVIVVEDEQGFYRTIDTSSATTFTKDGSAATASDVAVGSFVEASGSIDSNHTSLDATQVNVGRPAAPTASSSTSLGAAGQGAPPMG